MTPSQLAKSIGLKSLTKVSSLTVTGAIIAASSIPSSTSSKAKMEETAAATIPRGATQARKARSFRASFEPMTDTEEALKRSDA